MASEYMTFINLLPEGLPPDPTRERKISQAAKIDKISSQILIGTFAGFGTAAVAVRVFLHIRNRGKLFLDDYFVIFANACLLVETGALYYALDMIYVATVISHNPADIALFSRKQILRTFDGLLKWNNIYLSFAWTTNYAIKISFLAFFYTLIGNISRALSNYWLFALCFTIVSWLFNVLQNFIICGANHNLKCFPYPKFNLLMGGISTGADAATDLIVVSIPILLLRKIRLRLAEKIRIITFLSLSLTMLIFAFARLLGGFGRDYANIRVNWLTWSFLWLHLESSVAVLMGGLTAFRTVFARQVREGDESGSRRHGSFLLAQVFRFLGKNKENQESGSPIDRKKKDSFLGALRTGATLKGLRTFIRRHERQTGQTTLHDSLGDSTYDPLESYHNFKRQEEGNRAGSKGASPMQGQNIEEYEMIQHPIPELQTHNIL